MLRLSIRALFAALVLWCGVATGADTVPSPRPSPPPSVVPVEYPMCWTPQQAQVYSAIASRVGVTIRNDGRGLYLPRDFPFLRIHDDGAPMFNQGPYVRQQYTGQGAQGPSPFKSAYFTADNKFRDMHLGWKAQQLLNKGTKGALLQLDADTLSKMGHAFEIDQETYLMIERLHSTGELDGRTLPISVVVIQDPSANTTRGFRANASSFAKSLGRVPNNPFTPGALLQMAGGNDLAGEAVDATLDNRHMWATTADYARSTGRIGARRLVQSGRVTARFIARNGRAAAGCATGGTIAGVSAQTALRSGVSQLATRGALTTATRGGLYGIIVAEVVILGVEVKEIHRFAGIRRKNMVAYGPARSTHLDRAGLTEPDTGGWWTNADGTNGYSVFFARTYLSWGPFR